MKNPPSVTKPPPMAVGLKGYRLTWDKTPDGVQAIVTDPSVKVVLQRQFGNLSVEQMADREAVIWRDVLLKRNPADKPPSRYNWYVVDGSGVIVSGWDYREDAKEDATGWKESGRGVRVASLRTLISEGTNPNDWNSWERGAYQAKKSNPAHGACPECGNARNECSCEELTFKDLDVGDKFEFVRDGISTTQMAHGPWRKFGPQKYQHENGTVILRIGTTSARVRRVNPAPRGAAWVTSEEASDEDIKRLEDAGMIQFGGKTRDGVRMYFLTSKGSGALSGPDYDAEHPFGFVSHDPELEPELAAWDAMSRRSYGRKRNPGSVTFPTVAEVTAGLKDLQKEVRKWQGLRGDGVDVRLQVTSKSWAIHYGDPGYDQDHHGWWGADFLGPDALDTDLKAMAKRLIEEAEEQFQEELS